MTRAQAVDAFVAEKVKKRAAELRVQSKRLLAEALRLEGDSPARHAFDFLPFDSGEADVLQARLGTFQISCEAAARYIATATGVSISYVWNEETYTVNP